MANSSKARTAQKSLDLEFSLADGSILRGKIFVPIQTRLSDVLNDPRQFLPVESSDGALLALAKSSIKHVTLLAPQKASAV
jgi:hypothetical protein